MSGGFDWEFGSGLGLLCDYLESGLSRGCLLVGRSSVFDSCLLGVWVSQCQGFSEEGV